MVNVGGWNILFIFMCFNKFSPQGWSSSDSKLYIFFIIKALITILILLIVTHSVLNTFKFLLIIKPCFNYLKIRFNIIFN